MSSSNNNLYASVEKWDEKANTIYEDQFKKIEKLKKVAEKLKQVVEAATQKKNVVYIGTLQIEEGKLVVVFDGESHPIETMDEIKKLMTKALLRQNAEIPERTMNNTTMFSELEKFIR
jgi:hypothetical protein